MKPELAHLFTRPFWLDEWHTALVANRATLAEVFADLYRGSDLGPPVLHLIGWVLARFNGGHLAPAAARVVSVSAVLIAVVFIFLILRRRLARTASVAGALAVASHYFVVYHAFEFRYYCLWLGLAAAVAWSFGVDGERAGSRRRDVALALLSVVLCLTHWLALGSLLLMSAGVVATFGRAWRAGLRRVAPAAAGVAIVALSIPFVRAQRASVVETSWMPDPTFGDFVSVLDTYWAGIVLVLAVVVILTGLVAPPLKGAVNGLVATVARDPSIGATVALAALPLGMVVVSLGFPALHNRYSIATVLSWGPIVAVAVAVLGQPAPGRPLRIAMRGARAGAFLLMLFFLWANGLNTAVSASQQAIAIDLSRKALAQACAQQVPIVFQTRHIMYPTTDGNRRAWTGCEPEYLAISDATLARMFPRDPNPRRFFRFENEIARLHERLYAYPRVAPEARADSLPKFLLFGWDDVLPAGYTDAVAFGRAVFPRHAVTRLTDGVALFERQ